MFIESSSILTLKAIHFIMLILNSYFLAHKVILLKAICSAILTFILFINNEILALSARNISANLVQTCSRLLK